MASAQVIVSVAIFTGVLAAMRNERIVRGARLPASVYTRLEGFVLYGIAALLFGLGAERAYDWIGERWSGDVGLLFLILAVGIALALTVAAWSLRRTVGGKIVLVWILMNIVWAVGYGWLLPQTLD